MCVCYFCFLGFLLLICDKMHSIILYEKAEVRRNLSCVSCDVYFFLLLVIVLMNFSFYAAAGTQFDS